MYTITCHRCGRDVTKPEGIDVWDGMCACGRSVFEPFQDDELEISPIEASELLDRAELIRAIAWQLEEEALERGTATLKEIIRTGKFPDNWEEINRDPVALNDLETGKPIRVILKALTLEEVHHLSKTMDK